MIVKDAWRRWLPGGAELVGLGFVSQIGLQPLWSMRRQLFIQEHPECGHDYFVAYSCKGRGVWPRVHHAMHGGDGGAPWRNRFHPPVGLQPERAYSLPRLCGRRGV